MLCTKRYDQQLVLSRTTLKVETTDTTSVNVLGMRFESCDHAELETARRIPRRDADGHLQLPAPRSVTDAAELIQPDNIRPAQDAAVAGASAGVSAAGLARVAGWILTAPFFGHHYIAIGVASGIMAASRQLRHSLESAEDRRALEAGLRNYANHPGPPPAGSVER